jgi:flagellar FliJ protein
MAKFVFRLQNVLDIKLRLETQEKTAYAQAAARLADEEAHLQRLIARQHGYEDEMRNVSQDTLNIMQLRRLNDAISVMKELIQRQYVNVRVAEKNLDLARARLNAAMQERKTYEKLKENAFEEFKLELADEEKKEIDQLVSYTYNNPDREG